ncbi:MAG: hypothetical protein H7Y41_02305 [Hyphomonadaceae bacterium]|nr:hypothetical protein [Clostridia bacterium]
MEPDKYDLMSRSKDELVTLISQLMDKLAGKERVEFVSRWISPQVALEEAGACDSSSLMQKVDLFCDECMDGMYFIACDYDDYDYVYDYDDYDDETDCFSESKWAHQFSTFLELAVMYSRNKNYDITYKAFDKLLTCLHKANFDEEILGTQHPMDYIEVDWDEVFEEYYSSMKNQISDKMQVASKAVEVWMNFEKYCTDIILENIDDITYVEQSIRENIGKNADCWHVQHALYELLKSFYIKLDLEFNERIIAKSLVCYNANFWNDVAQAYISCEMWEEAVGVINNALKQVTNEQVFSMLNKKMVDCYESLGMFSEAYDIAVKMFIDDYSHALYLRARSFAIRIGALNTFVDSMEKCIVASKSYNSVSKLLRILSFEGRTQKLIDTALNTDGYSRHDYLKYTTKSLIYRALGWKFITLPNLNGFLRAIENNKIDGIVDMIKETEHSESEQFCLNSAIDILKLMVQFHINASKRSRYARAAYYCAVIKDIYTFINEGNEFERYYEGIFVQNKRRPALKDEMKREIG